ncbi:NADPH:quinone reductase-like Zn-dependent oxidoreductase [Micromonospora violae]|uniref:NADPH:quinone reductase-like Zn-dependent oxidoreductase n=1 Tax=Micromonospora violae TaxID=1278207 RepID=A0A4V2FPR0_9ACTN|nr:NADP-dependent oxidoreductase [Micromonospora violae]RZT81610.1 NADPH:quinone reductase-like Zn-dependent oxidoreductase [Micromonospora violae]
MRAVGFTEFGGPEVMRVLELPEPHAGPGQVRIKVGAADINPSDIAFRSGVIRKLMPGAFPASDAYVVGWDAAGVIDEVGEGVRPELTVGTPALALVVPRLALGAQAEYLVAPAESVVRAPQGIELAAASTLLMNGVSAWHAVELLEVTPGATVAVIGASGAVGGYAVQLARAAGLTVIADAAERDRDLVAALGADHVVPRGDGFVEAVLRLRPNGVDGLIDTAQFTGASAAAVRDGAVIATLRPAVNAATDRGVRSGDVNVIKYSGDTSVLNTLRDHAESGVLTLRVAATFAPEEAAQAHAFLEAGGVRGRPVIVF